MAKIWGNLERAQIESVGTLPSASVDKAKGRIVYLTTDDRYYISDGTNWIKIMPDTTTTKGDLTSFSTVPARLGVGSNGQVLTADSGEATGLKWATNPSAPDQSYEISNLSLAASVGSNALTIAVKDKGGSDPSGGSVVKVGTRNSTLSTGTYNQRTISSALSMTVSSGSTLGHASAIEHYIYVYLIDNAGTLELAVSTTYYEDHSIISTTAEGGAGAADSNSVIYSTTARSNVAIRLIGRLLSTQTTAGTWAAVPSEIKLVPFDSKTITACYSTNAGNGLTTGTNTFIDFEDKIWDTHNIAQGAGSGNVTTTNTGFKIVVPKTAYYDCHAIVHLQAQAYTATTNFNFDFYVNGTRISSYNQEAQNNSTQNWSSQIHTVLQLNAGDRVEVVYSHNEGSTRNLNTANYSNRFTITEVA